jgi:hypothetical protein
MSAKPKTKLGLRSMSNLKKVLDILKGIFKMFVGSILNSVENFEKA